MCYCVWRESIIEQQKCGQYKAITLLLTPKYLLSHQNQYQIACIEILQMNIFTTFNSNNCLNNFICVPY